MGRLRGSMWSLVLLFSAAAGALIVLLATPARASCHASGSPFNVAYQNGTGGRGVRVANPGMGVFNGSVVCGRVSSIFVYSADLTDFVEVGWYESPQGQYTCIPTTSGSVKELGFAFQDGMSNCLESPATVSEGTDFFSIRDDNQNGIWTFTHDEVQIWIGPNMGSFNSGVQLDNGERLSTGNTSHADFDGLQKRNSSEQWVSWSGTFLSVDDDSGAKGCKYSDTHTAVKLNATAC